jgi:flagellar biosynthesis GTPase FlhF
MFRVLFLWVVLIFQLNAFAQSVVGGNQVEKTALENEYLIKTSIKGLKQVDIAKLIVEVDSNHQFKKSANNPYFFDRDQQGIKFYIMEIPPSGEINLEFLIVLADHGNFDFPIKIQYAKNDEKRQLDLPTIKIANLPLLAVESQNSKETEQEKLLAEQKLEQEKLAKNSARLNAEREEKEKQEAIKAKETAEKLAAETERITKEKAQQEAQAKLLAKQNAKELADKLVREKAEEQKLLAEQKAIELAVAENKTTSTKYYSVQLLSLSNFSEERLKSYCKKHNLPINEIIKRPIGAMVKISYGKVNSQEAATQLQQKLKRDHQINESFIVVL